MNEKILADALILTKQVQEGGLNGETVYICHYNQPDLNKKPLRNVKPTECIVLSNDEAPSNQTIYYSKSHYRALNKKGVPAGRAISPVDNTGFRSMQGNPLYTFKKQVACIAAWNYMLSLVGSELEDKLRNAETYIKQDIDKINCMKL